MFGCDANMTVLYDKMVLELLPLTDDVLDDLKSHVIRYVYGDVQSSSLSLARAAKWKKQKKKSLIRLPPDDDSLRQHIKRANFLACIQRHPDLIRHPSPIGHGWELVNGRCRPVRHTKPALPLSLSVLTPPLDGYLTLRLILTLKPILTLRQSLRHQYCARLFG